MSGDRARRLTLAGVLLAGLAVIALTRQPAGAPPVGALVLTDSAVVPGADPASWTELARVVREHPDLVVLATGGGDLRADVPARTVERAAAQTLADLHRSLPTTDVVVVAPSTPAGVPPARAAAVGAAVRAAASVFGVRYLDPRRLRDQRLLGARLRGALRGRPAH